jgi:DNA-binding transcriptional MerR regulator
VPSKQLAGRRWSIGELARATGITTRTLYHYDEIGLVSAGERTESGHRRYTEADVRRLYRVRALRGLGLSLREVAAVLERQADDLTTLRRLLTSQLADLDAQAARIARLRRQVGELLTRLTDAALPDPDRFMATLELASMAEIHFTREQREFLLRRADEVGAGAVQSMQAEAVGLLEKIRQHQQAGTPADDPQVQELTTQVDEIGTAFHGGSPRITAAANAMWRDNRAEISHVLGWPEPGNGPDIVDYLQRARRARLRAGERPGP